MTPDREPLTVNAPALSDEAAAQCLEFIYEFLECFENRYGDQVHRYYRGERTDEAAASTISLPDPPF